MKLTFVFLTAAFLNVHAAGLAQKVTLTVTKASLEKVFTSVEKQTGYVFFFDEGILKDAKPVSIQVSNMPLEDFLSTIFKDQPLKYSFQNKTIVISLRSPLSRLADRQPSLRSLNTEAMFSSSLNMPPPPMDIAGRVTDEDGNPLVGATVRVKGTFKGTSTNANGEFILKNVDENATVEISYIGFETQQVNVKSNISALTIALKKTPNELDEAVIIGYGTTTKRFSTGQMTSISADQIAQQPVTNVMQALQGLVPGLSIVQSNGYASGQFNITIRGKKDFFGSSTAPSNPLVIVDGVPLPTSYGDINRVGLNQNIILGANSGQNPFFGINPNDIESIEVLKDADATAIYGSRGGNGVILITTKKGRSSQNGLTVNAYTGITGKPKTIDLLNTQQYLAMRREAFKNSGITPTAANAPDLFSYDTTRNVNWQKELGATSTSSDVEVGYQGGDALTNFRFNGAYHRDGFPVPSGLPNSFSSQRFSGSLGINHSSLDKRLTSSIVINYSNTNETTPSGGFYQYYLPPDAPDILDAAGKLNFTQYGNNYPFQLTTLFQPYSAKTNNFSSNAVFNYNIAKGLTATASLGYSQTDMKQFAAYPGSSQFAGAPATASQAQYGNNAVKNWIVEPRVDYKKSIGQGDLQITAGGTLTESIVNGSGVTGSGYINESLIANEGAATSLQATSNYSQYRFQGYFARINYNWKSKYILNVSGRRDASSRFAAGDQWGNFGSLGAAWLFSEEGFIKDNLSFLSFGKLRGSYGSTGSPTANDYQYLSLYSASNTYNSTTILAQNQAYNPGFKWQVNNKAAAGIELGFFEDRIYLTADWYQERSGNQLVSYPFPGYIGLFPIIQNLPAVIQNQGWEFTLQSAILKKKDLQWMMSINLAINRNKLLSFPGIALTSYNSQYAVGLPLNVRKVYHYTGVDPATGLYTFQDKDGNGVTNTSDQDYLDLTPKFSGGIIQNLTYRNWQLAMIFSYAKQTGAYALTNGLAGDANNQPVTVLERWQKSGDVTNVRKFTTSASTDVFNYQQSDALITNASYIRLQNVSLSYSLKKAWLERAHLKGLRVYVACQNLFTISPFKGYDPTNPGLSNTNFPAPGIYTAGFQLTL